MTGQNGNVNVYSLRVAAVAAADRLKTSENPKSKAEILERLEKEFSNLFDGVPVIVSPVGDNLASGIIGEPSGRYLFSVDLQPDGAVRISLVKIPLGGIKSG